MNLWYRFHNGYVIFTGETGTVAGWGRLSEGGQLPNILQYVSCLLIYRVIKSIAN